MTFTLSHHISIIYELFITKKTSFIIPDLLYRYSSLQNYIIVSLFATIIIDFFLYAHKPLITQHLEKNQPLKCPNRSVVNVYWEAIERFFHAFQSYLFYSHKAFLNVDSMAAFFTLFQYTILPCRLGDASIYRKV